MRHGRVLLAVLSALVVVLTGYGWSTFQQLQGSLATADVIGGRDAAEATTDILLVGNDARTGAQGNQLPPEVLDQLGAAGNGGRLTDTMILLRLQENGDRAVALSFPRDLYVQMPAGYGRHKLNSAYSRARTETAARLRARGLSAAQVSERSVQAGRRFLVRTIETLAGVSVDHYAEVNLLGFAQLAEAVGGVRVCLRRSVNDPYSGADFPAGAQRLSGAEALAFVRQRHGLPRGGFDRIVRQQVFMASLADKLLSAGILSNPGRIRDIVDATEQALVLDEGFDILSLAARVQGIASGDIRFLTVPDQGRSQRATDYALAVDRQRVQRFVTQAIEPRPPQPEPAENTDDVRVNVFNTTQVDNLAGRVSDTLDGKGFTIGTVADADAPRATVVRYGADAADAAESVAESLGGLATQQNSRLAANQIEVYLAGTYSGPGRGGIRGAARGVGGRAGTVTAQTVASARAAAQPSQPPVEADDIPCVY